MERFLQALAAATVLAAVAGVPNASRGQATNRGEQLYASTPAVTAEGSYPYTLTQSAAPTAQASYQFTQAPTAAATYLYTPTPSAAPTAAPAAYNTATSTSATSLPGRPTMAPTQSPVLTTYPSTTTSNTEFVVPPTMVPSAAPSQVGGGAATAYTLAPAGSTATYTFAPTAAPSPAPTDNYCEISQAQSPPPGPPFYAVSQYRDVCEADCESQCSSYFDDKWSSLSPAQQAACTKQHCCYTLAQMHKCPDSDLTTLPSSPTRCARYEVHKTGVVPDNTIPIFVGVSATPGSGSAGGGGGSGRLRKLMERVMADMGA
ncbi:hypothetical protein JKP88DRAFT_248196 [Tribonema minus]|uniref:Uncharacterized protein n=1 Tax=Tribonema minus TaxID=303371 RepID=A0A836CA85_9STRA|nr:hypothetical protein JKP88DRAFT_248196 [Tribonema minus]